MTSHFSRYIPISLMIAVSCLMFGCYPRAWTTDVSEFTVSAVEQSYREFLGNALILPFWEQYKDTKCESKYFIAPPVFISSDQLSQLTEHLDTYKNRATIYLLVHPTWRLNSTLLGLYVLFPDGHLIWIRYDSRKSEITWVEMQHASIGVKWKRDLIQDLRRKGFQISGQGNDRKFHVVPLRLTGNKPCTPNKKNSPCCYHPYATIAPRNPQQLLDAIEYIEQLPPVSESIADHWVISASDDERPDTSLTL